MKPGPIVAALVAMLVLLGACTGGVLLSLGGDEQEQTQGAALAAGVCYPASPTADAATPATVAGLDAEQISNARVIIAEGKRRGIPPYGWVVAIAGARQESTLRNLSYGHASSVGLFQLIAAHGTAAQRQDPLFATSWFYTELVKVRGWELLPVTKAAQGALKSGHPNAYAQWEGLARQTVAALEGGVEVTGGTACGVPVTGTICPAHEQSPRLENRLTTPAINLSRCAFQAFGASPFRGGLGGWAPGTGHVKGSYHYRGEAIDWGVRQWETGAGTPYGDAVAAWGVANAQAFGIVEIIWNDRIWRARTGQWGPYKHRCGCNDPNLQHRNHVHFSVPGPTLAGAL